MNVLVTGGAGYIGSHTVRKLRDAGYDIAIFDNLSSGHREAVRDFELIEGDLADRDALHRLFAERKFDAVIHFAGSIEAGESMTDPSRFFRNNVTNGLNLLDAMLAHDVKRIVFSSTAAVYGEPASMPITEEAPKEPTNVYGLTKLMFERILESYDRAYGLKSVSLRYFNAAGADPSGDIGEAHPRETHLIPILLETALGRRDGIRIFGTDYPTPDGTGVRDYVHVSDLADAHVLALDFLERENRSDAFNLGNGSGISVRGAIDAVRRVTETDFPVIQEARRAGDPAELYASSEKATRVLGWKPAHPSIEDMVRTAWNWHRSHPDGFVTERA
ncbi:MAG: UDP-glucose 4-epimerase GalE [Candidatus Moranbacteria bacterium]|nr:UDP-glucose 4-epimerase GalE [Candidatus Moranbacteria bacterium]